MRLALALLLLSSFAFSAIELPESFQANFIQKITNTKGKVIEYRGKIAFSDEKFFKWSYTYPTKKEVCTNGGRLSVIDHDLEQVSEYFINKGMDIAKILSKAKLYSENIYVARYENVKYTIQLHNNKLQSIAYFDALDNKVQIIFKGMRYGKGKLAKKDMLCDYPKLYDMIRG